MPDEPPYDPDRTVPEDLDFTDPDVALAYVNNPTTEALADDIGRRFRSKPASDQQRELSDYLHGLKEKRAEVAAAIEDLDRDEPGAGLQQLLDTLDKYIEAATLRMLELD